ncbi:CDP-alcohol phosphatidyltransferase family protein [Virgibacillus siamensis]|uniref:CDP-alcohol phosphatidyltransferase family protein n=1 Tax=Virgibacillus siamensis TaxID=480071 RepID=UPI00098586E8|nr:CDP-alcohol phosphatidyltransferase family protein [Virgibacillus siamensis]
MNKTITINSIRDSLPSKKNKIDKMDIWVYFIIRPLSYYVTWLFLKLRINPNMATVISIFVGVIGSILLISDYQYLRIAAAFIINFWIVLDCVDGNLARFLNKTSKFGEFLDGFSGYVFSTIMYVSIGMSVYFSENVVTIFYEMKWIYILLGCLTSIAIIFPRLIAHKAHTMFDNFKSKTTNKESYSLFYLIGLNVAGVAGFINPLLFVAILTQTLNVFLILYFIIHSLIALYSIYGTFVEIPKD